MAKQARTTFSPTSASRHRRMLFFSANRRTSNKIKWIWNLCWLLGLLNVLSGVWLVGHVHKATYAISLANMQKEMAMTAALLPIKETTATNGTTTTSPTAPYKYHNSYTKTIDENGASTAVATKRKAENAVKNQAVIVSADTQMNQSKYDDNSRGGIVQYLKSSISVTQNHSANVRTKSDILPPATNAVQHLGVLVDSGRHMFSWKWLYDLLDTLSLLDFNLIHFRLTDDQLFAMELRDVSLVDKERFYSDPEWEDLQAQLKRIINSSSTPTSSTTQREQQSVPYLYKQQDLKEYVRHAKSKYNITVIPEINIPGHGGAWGPEWVVPCPVFACEKGYGLPLNVTHPNLTTVLASLLQQVVDVFDRPPFLHLGGDELHLAEACLQEVGIDDLESAWYPLVEKFEEEVNKIVTSELGYKESQIIRWEQKQEKAGQFGGKGRQQQSTQRTYYRTGSITQYWQSIPRNETNPWFASTALYMDILGDDGHGHGDYKNAMKLLASNPKQTQQTRKPKTRQQPPIAIVVGTFELSEEYWLDRNVVGRLLAVRMALAEKLPYLFSQESFDKKYNEVCTALVSHWEKERGRMKGDDDILLPPCRALGKPLLSPASYRIKWKRTWELWKQRTCNLLVSEEDATRLVRARKNIHWLRPLNELFWDGVAENLLRNNKNKEKNTIGDVHVMGMSKDLPLTHHQSSDGRRVHSSRSSTIEKPGVLLDLLNTPFLPTLADFQDLFLKMNRLGLNWVQLRVAGDDGVVINLKSLRKAGYRLRDGHDNTTKWSMYQPNQITEIVQLAQTMGVEIVPEVSISTNAGGWYGRQILAQCPHHMCEHGRNIAVDISDDAARRSNNDVLPTLLVAILELKKLFVGGGEYFHLGHDEREASQACLEEAGITNGLLRWQSFEKKLSLGVELLGINLDKIVRWENQEKQQYIPRTGRITQFTSFPGDAGDSNTSSYRPRHAAKSGFEGEIWGHIALEGLTPWEIYAKARQWSSQIGPARLVIGHLMIGQEEDLHAKTRPSSSSQLVAYAIGVSDMESLEETSFERLHSELCISFNKCKSLSSALNNRTADDNAFFTQGKSDTLTEEELDKGCSDRTVGTRLFHSRLHRPNAANFGI